MEISQTNLSESFVGCRAELNVNKGRRTLLLSVAGQSDQTYCKLLGRIGKTMNYSPGLSVYIVILYIFIVNHLSNKFLLYIARFQEITTVKIQLDISIL